MRISFLVLFSFLLSEFAFAQTYVKPYVRRDGTYVEGHMRSNPNAQRFDNYNSQGNTNPFTGQRGSERNEFSPEPAYNTGRQPSYNHPSPSYSNPYQTPNPYQYRNPFAPKDD
jgi:hypothetical protein